MNKKKWIGITLAAVALVAAGWFVGLPMVMMGPRNYIGMLRYDQREEGKLAVGQKAPDATLVLLDGASRVRLSESIGEKPVVLIFGSFT